MGDSAANSVVDRNQRSWVHTNLYITGSSVFPTVATGNPSLTIAALAFWAADNIKNQLGA
jgi:choline dehydrogenase-like flavoprotein